MRRVYWQKKENGRKGSDNFFQCLMESEEDMLYRLFKIRKKRITPEERKIMERRNEADCGPS